MKVLYIITKADRGGAQVHLLDLLTSLPSGYDPMIATGEEGFLTREAARLGIPVQIVPSLVQPISPLKDLTALISLVRVIRKTDPDLVHVHTSKAALLGRLAAVLAGKPSVFTAHTWSFTDGIPWAQKAISVPLERLAALGCEKIINVSQANVAMARRHSIGGDNRLVCIWNGIPDVSLRAQPGSNHPTTLVMTARFVPQKNQLLFVEAMAGVEGDWRIRLVGDGPTKPLVEAAVDRLGIKERVSFEGERQDVPKLLSEADIFVLASNWEGLPLSILEAMRAALPVVASRVGGVEESVLDGITGFLTPPQEVEPLRNRLQTLVSSKALQKQMGQRGRKRYEQEFQVAAMVRKTLVIYGEALARTSPKFEVSRAAGAGKDALDLRSEYSGGEGFEISSRPRILYMITRAERGGAQSHVLEVAQGMCDQYEVHVATGEEGFLTEACRAASIPVHIIPHLQREVRPVLDLRAWFETVELVKRIRPDLIHAHTWKSGFIGRLVGVVYGIPSIYTVHMWPFGPDLPATWRLLGPPIERLAARWSRRLITVSESAAEVGRRYRIAPSSRMIAIENGIQDCAGRAKLDRRGVPVIAMVARFAALKDHSTLLRAFAQLELPARLMLVGDGSTRAAAEKLVAELGIEERVEFTGERSDIAALLTEIDIFVLASKNELLPISIIEAMRAGLPVIATRLGGIPQLTVDGVTGLLVERSSVEAMHEALHALVSDRELRIRLGRSGRQRYEQRFMSRSMCARTRSVYEEVLLENGRSTPAQAQFASQK